jgi:hypothetical protein
VQYIGRIRVLKQLAKDQNISNKWDSHLLLAAKTKQSAREDRGKKSRRSLIRYVMQ